MYENNSAGLLSCNGVPLYGAAMKNAVIADETISSTKQIDIPENAVLKGLFGSLGMNRVGIQYDSNADEYAQTVRLVYDLKTMESVEVDEALFDRLVYSSMSVGNNIVYLEYCDDETFNIIIYDSESIKPVSKFKCADYRFADTYFDGESNIEYDPDTNRWKRVKYGADGSKNVIAELGEHELPEDEDRLTASSKTLYFTQVSDTYYIASKGSDIYLCTYEGGADSAELVYTSKDS